MNLLLHHIAYPVRSLGPGMRAGIWVSGCARKCPGCMSPELQLKESGYPVPVQRLAQRLLELALPLEGLTISGGEPLEQPEALQHLLETIHQRRPSWSTILYTGHYYEERATHQAAAAVLQRVDLLIDGPYDAARPSEHTLAGSGGQRVLPLTASGHQLLTRLEQKKSPSHDLGLGLGATVRRIGVGAACLP